MSCKKLMVILFALSVLVSATSCGGNTDNAASTASSQKSSSTSASASSDSPAAEPAQPGGTGIDAVAPMADADTPITYNIFVRDPGQAPAADNPVINKITELSGVTIKYEFLVGDLAQKLGVMIAGGDYPDAIFAGDSSSKLIEAGAFIPLEERISDYPNLKAMYEQNYEMMKAEDGHIYTMDIYSTTKNDVAAPGPVFECGVGFFIQKAVLEEFGYPIPRTLEEYFQLIADYKEKYPEIDGMKTIGYEILADGWRNWALVNPPQNLLGGSNDGALWVDYNDNYSTSFYQAGDTAYNYLKSVNMAYRKGLIEPETLTQSYDQYIARMSTGAVLGFYDQNWNFGSGQDVLKADGKFNRTYIAVPLTNEGVTDGYLDAPKPSVSAVNGIGITVNCENPERLMAFYDWTLQREVQDYLQWGIEGTDWVYSDDGTGRLYTEETRNIRRDVAQKRDLTGHTLINYMPKWLGIYNSDGMPCSADISADEFLAALSPYDMEFLGHYDAKYPAEIMSDPVLRPDYYPIWAMTLEDGSAAAVSNQKITDSTTKYYPQLILAADDAQFETIWTAFKAEFESIDLEAYQTEIDRQIALKMSK